MTLLQRADARIGTSPGIRAACFAQLVRIAAELIRRRTESVALAHLHAMSDRELKDIGISRGQIGAAVSGRLDRSQPGDRA